VEENVDGPGVREPLEGRSVHEDVLVQGEGHVLEHDEGVGGGERGQQRGGGGGQLWAGQHHQTQTGAHRPGQTHRDAHVAVDVAVAGHHVFKGAAVRAAVGHFTANSVTENVKFKSGQITRTLNYQPDKNKNAQVFKISNDICPKEKMF